MSQISRSLRRDRKTVRRALGERVDRRYRRSGSRRSKVDRYRERIEGWIRERIPVRRMLEMVREDREDPFLGGRSTFYARVARIRKEMGESRSEAVVRFEGMAGEYLQVDWGEAKLALGRGPRQRVYFLCCRLKYSRFMYVEAARDMQLERLLRGLVRCFERLGGVPWHIVFDNMKTVVSGRDERGEPIWNETFKKFVADMDFCPGVCAPRAARQKGTVENLVKFVKSNFLPGRRFVDEADLSAELEQWLERVNGERSQAHGEIPAQVLAEQERPKLIALPEGASDYGVMQLLKVSRESVVQLGTNRYSVPLQYIGCTLLVRVHRRRLRIWDDERLVAEHERCLGSRQRIVEPSHFEAVLKARPRARVMLYREALQKLDGRVGEFLSQLCRRRRSQFGPEILALYELWQSHGSEEFITAIELALEQGTTAAEYVEALLRVPPHKRPIPLIPVPGAPRQEAVDRSLELYERYVQGGRATR